MKTANSSTPSRSKRKGAPDPLRFGRRAARKIASRPIGRFTRKTDCQPRCSVRKPPATGPKVLDDRSEEHTSELQSLMRISYAVFCLNKKKTDPTIREHTH